VSRPSKRQPYSLLIMPLRGGSGLFFVPESARAIIFIQDCGEASPSIDGAYLRMIYGLTRMEAALTVELMRNDGLQAAADVLGIAHSTAKSYLKRIFEKVGVHRQAELLRRLAKFQTVWE
jgi:DNA-binding CsgD family transcriptional regulator